MRQELPGWERGCETRVTWVGRVCDKSYLGGRESETRVT